MSNLPAFESRPVRKTTLRITRTGDGLSEALAIKPTVWHTGAQIYLVLRAEVTQVNHKREKPDDDDLVRVHTAEAQEVTEVEAQDIEEFLAGSRQRIAEARDKAAGQDSLPLDRGEPAVKGGVTVEDDE